MFGHSTAKEWIRTGLVQDAATVAYLNRIRDQARVVNRPHTQIVAGRKGTHGWLIALMQHFRQNAPDILERMTWIHSP
jgi:hypothetical protein